MGAKSFNSLLIIGRMKRIRDIQVCNRIERPYSCDNVTFFLMRGQERHQ